MALGIKIECAPHLHNPIALDLTDINKELPEKNKLKANLPLSGSTSRRILLNMAAKLANNG